MGGKLNIVIDYNNMAYRSMYICSMSKEYGAGNFDSESDCGILARKIVTDICSAVRPFRPNSVIIACDDKNPWRKEILKNEETGYKGSRKKPDGFNWSNIYDTMERVMDSLGKYGFGIAKIDGAEADDIAAMCVKKSKGDGDSIILISSDADWTQLVEMYNDKKGFCICMNPVMSKKKESYGKKVVYVPFGFEKYMKSYGNRNDLFFTGSDPVKDRISSVLLDASSYFIDEIDGESVLVEKIMCGDDGDDVPSFYEFYEKGKKKRITPKRAERILESISVSTVSGISEKCVDGSIKEAIGKVMGSSMDDLDEVERFKRQRRLVELNPDLFPDRICDSFDRKCIGGLFSCGGSFSDIRMEKVLEGTDYVDPEYGKKKAKVSAIFGDIIDNGLLGGKYPVKKIGF